VFSGGLSKIFFGVSDAEQRWLDAGAKITHILFGRLRIFSYYYDAGTYGAAMGQASITSLILFLGPFKKKLKIFFLLTGILCFYAMMISGTRGAMAVPAMGAIAYLVMVRRVKLILLGLFVIGLSFGFLKYTSIGQSNYSINRMRTALNPEDASLNTRLRNRQALSEYLQGKPFGGGVGSSGYWGRRFSKGTWLSHFEADGLYTLVRAETGIVGRNLFVGVLLLILFQGMAISHKLKNPRYRFYSMAILAGYSGILLANYGNSVMTQFPNNFVTFVGLAFVFSMKYWDDDGETVLPEKATPIEGCRTTSNSWNS
jgi:cell division protein FtsW (lipid II flippase)